jgi:hypothetical protein
MPDDNKAQQPDAEQGGEAPPAPDPVTTASVIHAIDSTDFKKDKFEKALIAHVDALLKKHTLEDYAFLLLFDDNDEIMEWHSNRIYRAASANASKKDILLLIHSKGGRIEPAYLISKTCQRRSKNKFIVAVPRKAKSAATLIALGADEIHMGLMSELGPIDPQIAGFPALGMKNALAQLAELSCKYPGASSMLGEYLNKKLDLHLLGYFERISESAVQYAERLLPEKVLPKGKTARQLADHFVNHYKDHGFVIDADEAAKLLGSKILKQETKEYLFVNEVYESLDVIRRLLQLLAEKDFDYCGSVTGGVHIRELKKKE